MALSRELMRRSRIIMRLARRAGPHFLQLGRYNYTSAHPPLPEHVHQKAIEICFLVKGRQTYRVRNRDYRLIGGDVFIAFPGEGHSTGGLPEERGVLYWLTLPVPAHPNAFLALPEKQSAALLRALQETSSRHFRGSWKMKEHLDAMTTLWHESSSPLNAFAIANHVGAFLLEIIHCARNVSARPALPLVPILRYIEKHLDEPLTVPQLAAQTGLSVPRFKARFRHEIGIPPGEYVLRAKIDEARRRLGRHDATITQIAFDLGFSTSQYFATVFKRFTGHTPSALLGLGLI